MKSGFGASDEEAQPKRIVSAAPRAREDGKPNCLIRLVPITTRDHGSDIAMSAAATPPNAQKKIAMPIWNRIVTSLPGTLLATVNQPT
jgi:hypothetical protein